MTVSVHLLNRFIRTLKNRCRNTAYIACFGLATSYLSGCVSILDATTPGPIKQQKGKRSFGTYLDDRKLTTTTTVNIRKSDPLLAESHIVVTSFNSIVLLTGDVPNLGLKALAGEVARNVEGARQVYNEIQVRPKSSFFSRSSDKVLLKKIQSSLLLTKGIDSDRVKVIVEDDIVYLMGSLSLSEAEAITEIVKATKGVKKVIRVIEYLLDE